MRKSILTLDWGVAAILAALSLSCASILSAQNPPAPAEQPPTSAPSQDPPAETPPALLPHLETDRVWLSGQANFISQYHPDFHSPYSGPNSFSAQAQDATSRLLTLFTGLRLSSSTEFLCDVQETGGNGLGVVLGLAGFTNLDVVRNPTLGKAPYVARLMWHQIIPLGHEKVPADSNPLSLFRELPKRRLEFRLGKFSMADFFDLNTYGTDSSFQFMNWTVDNNGAYDYAADTRGFTFGALLEYHQPHLVVRFAESLMPKVANGSHLDADLSRARAENLEFELHGTLLPNHEGILRLLTFVNHANMGSYSQAIDNFLDHLTPRPEITAHPLQTTIKYGFGVNLEQPLNSWLGVFARWGWNEGQHESYVYTEADETAQIGVGAANGAPWHRKFDRAGLVFVSNGISRDHQEYLSLGGLGFLLGDGRLNYSRENIFETYYTLHAWRGIYTSFDLQHLNNPGYNRDRGPILVPSLRLHLEF